MEIPANHHPESRHLCPPDPCVSLVFLVSRSTPEYNNVFLTAIGSKAIQPVLIPGSILLGVKFKAGSHKAFININIKDILSEDHKITDEYFTKLLTGNHNPKSFFRKVERV